jgi:hypothetical protein
MLAEGDIPQRARAEFTDPAVRLCTEDYERRLAWRSNGKGTETIRDADADDAESG